MQRQRFVLHKLAEWVLFQSTTFIQIIEHGKVELMAQGALRPMFFQVFLNPVLNSLHLSLYIVFQLDFYSSFTKSFIYSGLRDLFLCGFSKNNLSFFRQLLCFFFFFTKPSYYCRLQEDHAYRSLV